MAKSKTTQQSYAAFTTENKAIVGFLHAAAYFFGGYSKIELHATIAPLNCQWHEGEIEVTELYPDGKRLWLSVCDVRGIDQQRAEIEWAQWEEGFLTQGEWQRVAERFTAGMAVSACQCGTCRPTTNFSDGRMVLCSTCGNKRCPHATDHRNACTNSNEPGQPGSSYGGMNTPAAANVKHAAVAVPTLTAANVPPVKQWQDIGRAVDLSLEDLASVVDTLINRLGLQIVREQTPDYTNYELQPIGGDRATGGPK